VTFNYTLDRSAVPELTYNDLTLKVYVGDMTEAEVSTTNGITIPHTIDAGTLTFTTDADQVQLVLEGLTDPNRAGTNSVGEISKATLRDDKKWAWSIGLDDNVSLKPTIDLLRRRGWAGTLFMIGNIIDETRQEDWIVDAPDLNELLAEGWSVGNHTWEHECNGGFDYRQSILDGYNRLQEVVQNSPRPNYKIISFAAPCFDADYQPQILAMRDNGETAVQFNESGNKYLLIVDAVDAGDAGDAGESTDFEAADKTAVAFQIDMPIGRDHHIESDTAQVKAELDWMATYASSEHHFWYNSLSHGKHEDTIGEMVDYVYQSYGPAGSDEAWVAPSDAIYSYLLVRDNTVVSNE
jgi:hypothetical protein